MQIEWKRRFIIAGILAGVYAGYRYLLPAALPFLTAWVLAEWLYPVTIKIEKRTKIKKNITGIVLLALVFGAAGFLLYWGILELFSQLKAVALNWPVLQRWLGQLLDGCCGLLEDVAGIEASQSRKYVLEHVAGMGEGMLSSMGPRTLAGIFSCAKNLLLLASGAVVAFICAILLMTDMDNIRKKIWDYSWLVGTRRVVRRLKRTTVTYLKAQIVIIALVSAVCAAGFWIMKSPYFLILGLGLGVMDALPIIGTGAFLYPAAVIFLIRGRTAIAAGCVLLDIITSFLREFLEPRLLGGKLGVSPIAVLASVYAGMFLFGAWGVLLGPLSFSTVYEIGKEWDIWD